MVAAALFISCVHLPTGYVLASGAFWKVSRDDIQAALAVDHCRRAYRVHVIDGDEIHIYHTLEDKGYDQIERVGGMWKLVANVIAIE
jgi:hypothetical protein